MKRVHLCKQITAHGLQWVNGIHVTELLALDYNNREPIWSSLVLVRLHYYKIFNSYLP